MDESPDLSPGGVASGQTVVTDNTQTVDSAGHVTEISDETRNQADPPAFHFEPENQKDNSNDNEKKVDPETEVKYSNNDDAGNSPTVKPKRSVVKRVKFIEPADEETEDVDDREDADDPEDADGLPAPESLSQRRLSSDYKSADTPWPTKSAKLDNNVDQNVILSSKINHIDPISSKSESKIKSNVKNVGYKNGDKNGSVMIKDSATPKMERNHPPPAAPKGSRDCFHGRGSCQWGCCCATGWFMVGLVALVAGALLIYYLEDYWLAEKYSFERTLLYFGTALAIGGTVSILVSLGFLVCVAMVCNARKEKDLEKGSSKDDDRDAPKKKYIVNSVTEQISRQSRGHMAGPSEITVIPDTNYIPCVEYLETKQQSTAI